MEKPPKNTYESPLGSFEVDELPTLKAEDIGDGDRAFIYTQSGNRYMIRHSKGRDGKLVVYNEKQGFDAEHGHLFLMRKDVDTLAEVGQPFNYFAILDEKQETGGEAISTPVVRIEVRRGLETAVAQATKTQREGGTFSNITEALIQQTTGRMTGPADSAELAEKKLREKFKK